MIKCLHKRNPIFLRAYFIILAILSPFSPNYDKESSNDEEARKNRAALFSLSVTQILCVFNVTILESRI